MKTTARGSLYSVTVTSDEAKTLDTNAPDRPVTFWFDRISGDLVDMIPFEPARCRRTLVAAQAFGKNTLDAQERTHA